MVKSWKDVTPALLVALAFPVLFLIAPDGIPCVYAACGTHAGTIQNAAVDVCGNCSANDIWGDNESVTISSCSVTGSANYCVLTASVTLTMTRTLPYSNGCDVAWRTACGFNQCENDIVAASAPVTNYTIGRNVNCNQDDDLNAIYLFTMPNCNCDPLDSTGFLFIGTGTCDID